MIEAKNREIQIGHRYRRSGGMMPIRLEEQRGRIRADWTACRIYTYCLNAMSSCIVCLQFAKHNMNYYWYRYDRKGEEHTENRVTRSDRSKLL